MRLTIYLTHVQFRSTKPRDFELGLGCDQLVWDKIVLKLWNFGTLELWNDVLLARGKNTIENCNTDDNLKLAMIVDRLVFFLSNKVVVEN